MLQKVRNFWIKGVLEQSLYALARLELGLTTQPDAVEEVWDVLVQRPNQISHPLPPGTRISAAFDELGKALLILGAPGTGKTTLLLELTKDLLDQAEGDSNHPLPVVFNLSSWVTRQPPLASWLVDELCERYQVPRKHAQSWIDKDLILPLLDGLDEVAPRCRSICVEAINAFRTEHGLVPLAVCSRLADYEALATKLHLQSALVVQPLTREQTSHYLAQAGAMLAGVRAALRDDETLWELLNTPLMLSVAALAYQGRSAAEVAIRGTFEERKTQLFSAYVDAMFKRRGKALLYPPQKTIPWLAWLASAMARHNQSVFYMEWMQPSWLSSKWQQMLVNMGAHVLCSLVGALVSALVGGFFAGLFGGFVGALVGVLVGVLFGGFAGLIIGSNLSSDERLKLIHPVETVRWVWPKIHKNRVSWLLVILLYGLVGALTSGLFGWPNTALILFLVVIGLLVGALATLFHRALVLGNITTRVIPNEGIRRSSRNAFLFFGRLGGLGGVGGLVVWLVGGLLIGQFDDLYSALVGALFFALFVGLYVGLSGALRNGGIACFQHLILRFLLWFNGFAPWRYVRFLDFSAERVFLRKVGGGYIFVHRMLLEYFANLHPSDNKD